MPSCCVITCRNRSETKNYVKDGITYHIFPNDPNIKEKWMNTTGRGPDWFPVKRNVICSDHFEEECFQPLKKSRRLFEWAIPTVKICKFVATSTSEPVIECYNKEIKREKIDKSTTSKNIPETSSSSVEITESTTQNSPPANLTNADLKLSGDSRTLTETPRRRQLRQKVSKCESMIKKQKHLIKSLQRKNCRYHRKIKELEYIIEELNERNITHYTFVVMD